MSDAISSPSTTSSYASGGADGLAGGGSDPSREEQEFTAHLQRLAPAERADAQPAPRGDPMMSATIDRLDHLSQTLDVDLTSTGFTATKSTPPVGKTLAAGDPAALPPPEAAAPPASPFNQTIGWAMENFARMAASNVAVQVTITSAQATLHTGKQLMQGN